MRKTFKYRLYGNSTVFTKADSWLYLCRCLYNTALEQRISTYKRSKSQTSCYDQVNQLPELKKHFPEYAEVSSQALQDVIERLSRAYARFFQRIKEGSAKSGFPRFRGKDRYDSFMLKNRGWRIEGSNLFIRNLGKFKMRLSRPIGGDIKTVTIRKESNKWYVCFSCDNAPERKLSNLDKIVGIDVGIGSFLTDSDGNKIDNPQYLRQSESIVRRRQRTLSRRQKGSNRRHIAKILTIKVHEHIRNQRNDFLHKVANSYIQNYGTLVFESLSINSMVKNHHLAKSISDASWGKFYRLCAYKAEEAGRQIIRINRFEPTSKKCSQCGAINHKLKLSDRKWVCMSCGVLHDRDYNAAKNIKRVGQTQQALTCASTQIVACKSPTKGMPNHMVWLLKGYGIINNTSQEAI